MVRYYYAAFPETIYAAKTDRILYWIDYWAVSSAEDERQLVEQYNMVPVPDTLLKLLDIKEP